MNSLGGDLMVRPTEFIKERKRRGQGKFMGLDLQNRRQGSRSLVTEMAGRSRADCGWEKRY